MKTQTSIIIGLVTLFLITTSCYETAEELYTPGKSELFFPLKTGNSWTFMEYVTDTTSSWPNNTPVKIITLDSAKVKWTVTGSYMKENDEFYLIYVSYPDFPNRSGYFSISNKYNRIYRDLNHGYTPFRYYMYDKYSPRYLMHFDYATLDYGKPFSPDDGESEFTSGWTVTTALGMLMANRGKYNFFQLSHTGEIAETTSWYFSPLVGTTMYSFNSTNTYRKPDWSISSIVNLTCQGKLLSCHLN